MRGVNGLTKNLHNSFPCFCTCIYILSLSEGVDEVKRGLANLERVFEAQRNTHFYLQTFPADIGC